MNHTRRDFLKYGGATAVTAGTTATAGCTGALGMGISGDTVKVSSARFPESILLSYMAIESLQANTDVTVVNETALGGTGMNFRAVENGETSLFWLYTGGGWTTIPPQKSRVITDFRKLYRAVKQKMSRNYDLEYLNPTPFNNTYILVTTPEWAEKTGVRNMSDFAEYVNSGNTDFSVVMGPEFRTRPDGWPGLAKFYDFEANRSELNVRNVGATLTYQIVGTGGAEVGIGFSTNPKIRKFDLATIPDDKGFFPPYHPAPLVNEDVLEANPGIREPLDAIGPKINRDEIMRLNAEVSFRGRDARDVAREFLRSEGLLSV